MKLTMTWHSSFINLYYIVFEFRKKKQIKLICGPCEIVTSSLSDYFMGFLGYAELLMHLYQKYTRNQE
jgi:hypothetical protein